MSQYLQTTYNISKYEADQIGESRVYQNPQVLLFICVGPQPRGRTIQQTISDVCNTY